MRDAATYLGVSKATVYRLVSTRAVTSRREGAKVLVEQVSVEAHERATTTPAVQPVYAMTARQRARAEKPMADAPWVGLLDRRRPVRRAR